MRNDACARILHAMSALRIVGHIVLNVAASSSELSSVPPPAGRQEPVRLTDLTRPAWTFCSSSIHSITAELVLVRMATRNFFTFHLYYLECRPMLYVLRKIFLYLFSTVLKTIKNIWLVLIHTYFSISVSDGPSNTSLTVSPIRA